MPVYATKDKHDTAAPIPLLPATPSGLIAVRLIDELAVSEMPIVYVALSERAAEEVVSSIVCLEPEVKPVFLPPWDCLPFDRVPPSKQCMGRRMDALREWLQVQGRTTLLVTSLDACLQRIPPASVVRASQLSISVGADFDKKVFEDFVVRTGYSEDGLVDEPGEYAFRDGVVEIFPAGSVSPMRIMLSGEEKVAELRSYDPSTQRTTATVETMVFGPASELIVPGHGEGDEHLSAAAPMRRRLLQVYPHMQTVFDIVGDARMCFAEGVAKRLREYLDIIDEARAAYKGDMEEKGERSLYLDEAEFGRSRDEKAFVDLRLKTEAKLPWIGIKPNLAETALAFAESRIADKKPVVVAGTGRTADRFLHRLERRSGRTAHPVSGWSRINAEKDELLFSLSGTLHESFLAEPVGLAVISVSEVFGEQGAVSDPNVLLAEPDIVLGDVVVHEDHGVGVMKGLEAVEVDGNKRDAARLEYRDGGSILVPVDEFDKLWRYGSEPGAVSLDRLHTDAWTRKKAAIEAEIRKVAHHLLKLAKERASTVAEKFVPPVEGFEKVSGRFPYIETADQKAAIDAVLADLSSGKPMNRLICGDVGFGKTEVALRSAAAVALGGGQVALVCPTTVLARQHYTTFERRFAATGVNVAMLSKVATASEIKRVKEGLANGKIDVVVATQAILSSDVAFAKLSLLIVDEEHRFGKRDKSAMAGISPGLHRLAMSATPIPQTLQAAMIGLQDVSLLATPPFKRRPVRTSLSQFDRAAMQTGLSREHRRGGQSFVVVPQIEDIALVEQLLSELVPDLSVRVAHGKLPAAELDEIMVRFADGDGDILLATNIIESGLDVPNANTLFVWRADRFGLAQLHQLRGRVGRGKAQGVASLFTSLEDDVSDETNLRLSAMVAHDRLGDGLALSMQDLELRGTGDMIGEDQAGHLKVLGISLYRKVLERCVASMDLSGEVRGSSATISVGISGGIPDDYVPDAAVRLNLNSRLQRVQSLPEIDAFGEEFEDRFGEPPAEVQTLLRIAKLKMLASQARIVTINGGPKAVSVAFEGKPGSKVVAKLSRTCKPIRRDGRFIFQKSFDDPVERIAFLETLLNVPD